MSASECFFQVLDLSPPPLVVFWVFWCLVTLLTWVFAFSFFYLMITKLRHQDQSTENSNSNSESCWSKHLFQILLCITNISIVCNVTFCLPASIFLIHIWHGKDMASSIDYVADLNKCNHNEYNFYTNLYWIFAPPQLFFYDCSYTLILITYFYRLHKLFGGSAYQISKIKTRIFQILMITFIIISISRNCFFIVAVGSYKTVSLVLWNLFIIIYLIIIFYLAWNLNKQANMLKKQTMQVF